MNQSFGFWKGRIAQHCLLTMTEKWKESDASIHYNGACGALLIGLSKTFDGLPHSFLIAKLHAYGFDKTSTEYLKDYLSHRKQKVKINRTFSNWTNILLGAPLFNVFLCDLFLFISNIDYADDNT